MIKIAFDYQAFFFQEYGGISRYYSKLAGALNSIEGVEARIFALLHRNAYLTDSHLDFVIGWDTRKWPKSKKVFRAINGAGSRFCLDAYRPNIVHQTYYAHKPIAPRGVPLVVTVYDMIHERYADQFSRRDRISDIKKIAVERADHVICISNNTRDDLLKYFDTPQNKISVVHIGFDAFKLATEFPTAGSLLTVNRPYLLYVGQRSIYKNFLNFIKAFASSAQLKRDFDIVCFGGGRFTEEEKRIFVDLKLADSQVWQLGGADGLLVECYRNAFAFVYPSLYEGFGIPPLEAMSLSCPVICSRTSSIPEVAGPAAEYFEPSNIDSIREALEKVANSPARRAELIAFGLERFPFFTWHRCAKETYSIYKELV